MRRFLLWLLRGYKRRISPSLGNNCRFMPTCSEYAMDAIFLHGTAKGLLLAFWRFLRCNPFGKVGYDPVPEKGRWKSAVRSLHRERKRKKHEDEKV